MVDIGYRKWDPCFLVSDRRSRKNKIISSKWGSKLWVNYLNYIYILFYFLEERIE